MKTSVAAALVGLLFALLPWVPPFPARIAAADLPPTPPRGANISSESPSSGAGLGAASNSVVHAAEKAETNNARSVLPVNEPSVSTASNCSLSGDCVDVDSARRRQDSTAAPGNASQDKDVAPAVVAHNPDEGAVAPEEAPLSAEALSPVPEARGGEEEAAPPDLNALEEEAPLEGHPTTGASENSQTTGRSSLISSLPLGNHVFPTAPEGALGPSSARDKAGVAAAAPEDLVERRVTSTRETTIVVTSTPVTTVTVTSTIGKRGKTTKTKPMRRKGGKEADKEAEGGTGGGYGEVERIEEEAGEGSREEVPSTRRDEEPPERTTTVAGGDSLFFRHFSRIESRDSEEPGTTRSHHQLVLEKNTRLDYSSSHVVSEVYDSEAEEEDEEDDGEGPLLTTTPSTTPPFAQEDDEGQSSAEEETSDYGGGIMMEEDKPEGDGDFRRGASGSGREDQHPAPSTRGGEAVSSREASQSQQPTPVVATTTTETASTAGVAETTRKVNLIDGGGIAVDGDPGHTDAPSPTINPRTSATEVLKESNHGMGYTTDQGMVSTTSSYSPRTSRRLNLLRPSTTESPVKNEVTYNETVTGSAFDFKANLSYTTPMVHLLSAAPASSTEVLEPENAENPMQSTSPLTTLQTTGQSLTEVLLGSTADTTPTTELSHTTEERAEGGNEQGRGNSINDWTTISSLIDSEMSKEDESTSTPTTHAPTLSYESSTSQSLGPIVTSSVLFTTAQNTSAADLVSESMSVTSASEEVTSVPLFGSTASSSSESVSERVEVVVTEPFGRGNESTSESVLSSMSDSSVETSSNVTTSTGPPTSASVATSPADVSSSTSGDLLPDHEKTKVPPKGLVDEEGSTSSNASSQEYGISEAITTQPMFATAILSTTSPKEILGSTPAASKDSSPETTFLPILVKVNTSSAAGMTDMKYNTSTSSAGEDEESGGSILTYPWHVRLVMEVSWSEMCHTMPLSSLKQALAQLISSALMSNSGHSALPSDRVLLLNVAESCPSASPSPSEVHFCVLSALADSSSENRRVVEELDGVKGATVVHCDATLMQLFLDIWEKTPKPMGEPLMHVKEVGIAHSGLNVDVPMNPSDDGTGVQAAIGISCVAALALFLLAALLIIMRRRQRRFNYGQRCTPVSLDAYSLDSVSVREGSRRGGQARRNGDVGSGARRAAINGLCKGDGPNDWRASKRSYGNPAFEDDDGEEVLLSKPMNFAALTNAALDEDGALADEFRLIPKRFRRRTVRRKSRSKGRDVVGCVERGEAGTSKEDDDERLPEGAEEKNRYANVVPLTSTRVRLSARPSGPLSTYINANYVRGPKNEERFYIACQAPLQSTIEDFWRMIWEQQSKVILMLTNLFENSVEKCADYLPPSEVLDCHRLFGDFQVTLKKREVREKYIVSSLQLKNMESNLWREVTHLWFLGWPDQGVPDEANQVIAFLIEARSFIKTNPGPTVVHCSPGTGRTGTVISIDICIREFEQSRMVDVPKVVQQLRRDREGAVQTQQQYAFIYMALSLYAAKLTGGAMDSF